MKKFIITLFFLFEMITLSYSQVVGEARSISWFENTMLTFYIVVAFLFVIAILILVVAVYMLQVLHFMVRQAEQEKAAKLNIQYKPAISLWKRLWEQWNNLKPLEKESDILLDHNFDGIRELDNHLPPWWKWLFYATIGFSIVYLFVFHIFDTFPLQIKEYENEVAYAQEQAAKIKALNPVAAIDETNVEATTEALELADGKVTFLNTCATCHRKDGGGDIGPNLTDEYWLHGGSIKEIFKVVRHGVQGTNMIAWEGVISPEKIKNVASYLLTMQGLNPLNPKKPQGEIYKPKKKEMKPDTAKARATI